MVIEKLLLSNEPFLSALEKQKVYLPIEDNNIQKAFEIWNPILSQESKNDINLDYADITCILADSNQALVLQISLSLDIDIRVSLKELIGILQEDKIYGEVTGILIHLHIHPSISLLTISEVINIIEENSREDIDMILGTHENNLLSKFELSLSMIISYGKFKHLVVNK